MKRAAITLCLAAATGCRDWTKPVIPPDPSLASGMRAAPAPTRAELHAQSEALCAQGRFRDSLRALQRALALQPQDAQTELLIARAYVRLNDASSAAEFARLSAAHDTTPAWTLDCARVLVLANTPQAALQLVTTALAREGVDPAIQRELRAELALVQSAAGRHDAAIASARALTDDGGHASDWERLGYILLRAGKLAAAEEAYQAGTRIDSRAVECWNGAGTAALNRWIAGGRHDTQARARAVAAFDASLAVEPNQPRVVRLMASNGL